MMKEIDVISLLTAIKTAPVGSTIHINDYEKKGDENHENSKGQRN